MNGILHIEETFSALRARGRAAFMPYFTAGYPDFTASLEIITAAAHSGANLIEVGIPFSDPLADGPTIQHSTQAALSQGMSVLRCLELVAGLRLRGVHQPLLLMGYYNPILAFGLSGFVAAAAGAGADGLIVPDLPLEEAGELERACGRAGLALVYLLAPTSTPERARRIAGRSQGFLYLVSLTGVTGAREALPPDLGDFIARTREAARLPLAVGFGISRPEQAREVGRLADGVIVGSALVREIEAALEKGADPVQAVSDFVSAFCAALGDRDGTEQGPGFRTNETAISGIP